jgi:uncharacterized membrane protein
MKYADIIQTLARRSCDVAVKLWLTLSFIWLSAQSLKVTPATLFAYMWAFAVLPALTSAIVVVKAVTIFLGAPQRAPLWSSADWKGQ